MTSGQFHTVEPSFIWVDRAKRQRKELTGIEELANSIRQNGLIHPPVIKRDGELIVGERRWTAIKSLGWTAMPIQWVDDLDEDELQAIEYEENVTRADLPWQDQVMAVHNYHQHRMSHDPEWTATLTAERLGVTSANVSQKLDVAGQLIAGEKLVVEAPKFSVARNVTNRLEQRKKASAADRVAEIATSEPTPERTVPLLNADFHEWAAAYTGTPFNFLHCDFPYGINMDSSDQGNSVHGKYEDSPDVYWELLDSLAGSMDNLVAPSAHMIFWFSMDYYDATKNRLRSMGWSVSDFPLIWFKSDNAGILPDTNRRPWPR
jgi:ParB/RepB/Spo0J family partition protein